MSELFGSPHALLVLVLAGFLPNEIWRMAGLWFGAGVDEGSEVLIWVRAVATASSPASSRKFSCSRRARSPACRTGCATARSPPVLRCSC